ncbi:YqcI/YcgG family protein [Acinetobacter sp. UGAL515B_02]|nr:YqcI/YcgG family protein [Acinetobacter sp. UGAL515B_02]WON80610.1 YqcI/YcgG family protein [Acinetobacter sp. UGAL515B_02]
MNEIFKSGIIVEQSDIEMKANFNNGSLLSCNWMIEAYINFSNILSQNNFPCLFGRSAYKRKSLKFLFVNEIIDLQKGLLLYTDFIKKTPLEERLYSPLIITFRRIGFKNLTEEHEFCWEQLKLLHSLDEAEWPNDIPKDPHDNQWTFCFDQTQLFFNMSCPSHHHIKSRNLGPYVTFVVNPRQNLILSQV